MTGHQGGDIYISKGMTVITYILSVYEHYFLFISFYVHIIVLLTDYLCSMLCDEFVGIGLHSRSQYSRLTILSSLTFVSLM